MSWLTRLRNHLRSNRVSRDIEREMQFHLAERTDDLVASGMRPPDARREARRRFGHLAEQAENARHRDLFAWLDTLASDLRYAWRSGRGAPAFGIAAVLSIALGIGANTAIFSILDAVMLKQLPVEHPEQLVKLVRNDQEIFTNPLWEAIRDRQDVFDGAFAVGDLSANLAAGGEERPVAGSYVSGDYFSTLGVVPELGRLISHADDFRGCPGIAVLSDAFWRAEYAGDDGAIGKAVSINGHPFTIVGVADPRFHGVSVGRHPQIYAPLCARAVVQGANSDLDARSTWYLDIVGRPKPGLTASKIGARFAVLAPAIIEATMPPHWPAEAVASYRKSKFTVQPAAKGFSDLRSTYEKALYVLMTIVALVLAVACANVANLLLARAAVRRREMAVRLALGAGRGRLARQLITESLFLSLIGAALGGAFAVWGSRVLVGLLSHQGRGVSLDLSPDARVLWFTIGVATVTGLLFGVVPAWSAGRIDPQTAMKAQGRGLAEGHSRFRIGKALVVAQVAMSLLLVAGAGLLITSWRRLATVDPGFRRDGVVLASVNLHDLQLPPDQRAGVFDQMLSRLRALPGAKGASYSTLTPVGHTSWNDVLRTDGFAPTSLDDAVSWMNAVSPTYFTTLGIPLRSGRDFDQRDVANSTPVAIVDEAMARHFFGTANAIGKRFEIQHGDTWTEPIEVVGVVGDTKYASLRAQMMPVAYLPMTQQDQFPEDREFEVWTRGSTASMTRDVKAAIMSTGSHVSLTLTSMARQLDESTSLARAIAMLAGFFGALALLLASIGLYGVMAYTVARRRNEIGVRIALGAERGRVVRMVVGEVVAIVAIGALVGVALSTTATKLVTTFLYDIEPNDPATLAASVAVLLIIGVCAALSPAWRAAKVDPVAALRDD